MAAPVVRVGTFFETRPRRSSERGLRVLGSYATPQVAPLFPSQRSSDSGRRKRLSVSSADAAQNSERKYFAMRNETFRIADRKPLKSLWIPNQSFRRFVCFQGFSRHFVSPFFQKVSYRPQNRAANGLRSAPDLLTLPACNPRRCRSLRMISENVNIYLRFLLNRAPAHARQIRAQIAIRMNRTCRRGR